MFKKSLALVMLVPLLFVAGCVGTSETPSETEAGSTPTTAPGNTDASAEQDAAWGETMFDYNGATVDDQKEMGLAFCADLPTLTVEEYKNTHQQAEDSAFLMFVERQAVEILCPDLFETAEQLRADFTASFVGEQGFRDLLEFNGSTQDIENTIGMERALEVAYEACAMLEQGAEAFEQWYTNTLTSTAEDQLMAYSVSMEAGVMVFCLPTVEDLE